MQNLNDTAHKILDVAEHLTQSEGFNAFSYKDIQAEVGVKTSSIHYYFPTKQDLAVALAERYIQRFSSTLQNIEQTQPDGLQRLQLIGRIFADVASAGKLCLCGMLTSDALSLPEAGTRKLNGFYSDTENWIAEAISLGQSQGSIRTDLPSQPAARHFLATLEGGVLIARVRGDTDYITAVLQQGLQQLKNKT